MRARVDQVWRGGKRLPRLGHGYLAPQLINPSVLACKPRSTPRRNSRNSAALFAQRSTWLTGFGWIVGIVGVGRGVGFAGRVISTCVVRAAPIAATSTLRADEAVGRRLHKCDALCGSAFAHFGFDRGVATGDLIPTADSRKLRFAVKQEFAIKPDIMMVTTTSGLAFAFRPRQTRRFGKGL